MLKRQFKNPYYHLLEEAWYNTVAKDATTLASNAKSRSLQITKPITSRLYNRKVGLGALLGAGLVAGGIAAYNHFTDNEVPLTMPTIGGGVAGGIAGALHGDIPAISGFIGANGAAIASTLGLAAAITALVYHPYISLGIAGSLGSFAYVLNKKENVDQCKQLSNYIEKAYKKAILLRYNELQTIKDTCQKAFQEASSKCELGGPAFGKLNVNYNCALEAYIGYCTALFIGLLTVYLQSVNAKGYNLKNITKIEQVLAIREDTALNIMLTEIYNKFIKVITYVFKHFPEVLTKYNIYIDNTIMDITQKLDKVQPRQLPPQQQQYNNPKPAFRPNDHRQFKTKYIPSPRTG